MAARPFPRDPAARRAVLVLEQHQIDACSRAGQTEALLDSQTHVLVFGAQHECSDPALTNIVDGEYYQPGAVLVQNPFAPDEYENAAVAADRFAYAKHLHFSVFCARLGATRVSVEQVDVLTGDKVETFKADAERAGFGGKVDGERSSTRNQAAKFLMVDEYPAAAADIEAAEAFLVKHRLRRDANMHSLLLARTGAANPISRRTLILEVSAEANRNLQVAAGLKLPAIAIDGAYGAKDSQTRQYRLHYEIDFKERRTRKPAIFG